MRFGRSLESVSTNIDEHLLEQSYIFTGYGMLVADGIGGLDHGEVASSTALTKLVELILDTPDWTLALKRERDVRIVLQRMTKRFLQIDETLREEAKNHPALNRMATTLTVAGILGTDLVIGHVGDSRAYLFRGNELKQLTTDHTLAQALIDAGVANRDDPATRSMRHGFRRSSNKARCNSLATYLHVYNTFQCLAMSFLLIHLPTCCHW